MFGCGPRSSGAEFRERYLVGRVAQGETSSADLLAHHGVQHPNNRSGAGRVVVEPGQYVARCPPTKCSPKEINIALLCWRCIVRLRSTGLLGWIFKHVRLVPVDAHQILGSRDTLVRCTWRGQHRHGGTFGFQLGNEARDSKRLIRGRARGNHEHRRQDSGYSTHGQTIEPVPHAQYSPGVDTCHCYDNVSFSG